MVQSKAWSALGKSYFPIALRGLGWSSRQLRLPGSSSGLTVTAWLYCNSAIGNLAIFHALTFDWCGIYLNCAIGNLVNCMEVSDTYAHAACSIGSCPFKVAYFINVEQVYAMLLWFRMVTPETQCRGENLNNCYDHRSLQLYFSPTEYWYTITAIILLLQEAMCHCLQAFFHNLYPSFSDTIFDAAQ